jgi:UDP-N-acetylglucosamine:LPS N-acetylglucosamine transferase
MSVHPLWVTPGIDVHLAMHKIPADQAHCLGAAGVTLTAPIVESRFLSASTIAVEASRARFGLPTEGRLALVLAGSWGVGDITQTAIDIADSGLAIPVVVCGHNEELRRRLSELGVGIALGWVQQMPELVRAANVVDLRN